MIRYRLNTHVPSSMEANFAEVVRKARVLGLEFRRKQKQRNAIGRAQEGEAEKEAKTEGRDAWGQPPPAVAEISQAVDDFTPRMETIVLSQ